MRSDLCTVPIDGERRAARVVIDEVSGRFSRVTETVWQQLLHEQTEDTALWEQAHAANWTRQRSTSHENRFSLLAIRIPLGDVSRIAKGLVGLSGILFSPIAILFWSLVIVLAGVLALSRSAEWVATLRLMPLYLKTTSPWLISGTVVATKLVHELSHATMCERMGANSKSIGLFLFCGLPCPYCDVTDVWRLPSAARRAAVMLAGIYVELIIASLATLVWCISTDAATRLYAMNLMIVCGISTVLFNANPLMRYDGYFVLTDWLGSTNLRREAGEAFRRSIVAPVAGRGYGPTRHWGLRTIGLSVYHLASACYRVMVMVAIAVFAINIAAVFQMRFLGVFLVAIAAASWLVQRGQLMMGILQGRGPWSSVTWHRRGSIAACILGLILAILLIPTPRYRQATGWVDAAETTSIFLPAGSQVQLVETEFGHAVRQGDVMARLSDQSEHLERSRLSGELHLAKMRSDFARRDSLDRPEVAQQWTTLSAAEHAVASLLENAEQRLDRTQVRASESGIVLPGSVKLGIAKSRLTPWLAQTAGMVAHWPQPWCRICPNGRRHAVFLIDAQDLPWVTEGTNIRIRVESDSHRPSAKSNVETRIESISSIQPDDQSVTREAIYQVLCPLPEVEPGEMLDSVGTPCTGVVRLPSRAIGAELIQWIGEWVHGQS
ncbi:hypothetical protein Poly41_15910 [Novipirellula artificiosorum]|uniref:Peptidase family M50 n=2 Tax=Novipirellula artificiosorum TaxID=2528016 RepID=A0A5C6E098_9BACT|nr:hypothetical protein Poly41_15910 [Novipirellula artificiosorum]